MLFVLRSEAQLAVRPVLALLGRAPRLIGSSRCVMIHRTDPALRYAAGLWSPPLAVASCFSAQRGRDNDNHCLPMGVPAISKHRGAPSLWRRLRAERFRYVPRRSIHASLGWTIRVCARRRLLSKCSQRRRNLKLQCCIRRCPGHYGANRWCR